MQRAAYVRQRVRTLVTSEDSLRKALNAEEILLCGAVEAHLQRADQTERERLRRMLVQCFAGDWPQVVPD